MRPSLLVAAVVMLSSGFAAQAENFSFSFGDPTSPFSGSGTLTGSLVSPGEYLISSVTGTTMTSPNGRAIKIAGIIDPGGFPTLDNGGTEPPNDNLLLVTNGVGVFDANGLSYSLNNGAQINLFNEGVGYDDALLERSNGKTVFESVPVNVTEVTAVTPEPSSFVLLGTGLLGALGAARRRLA